jgi:hypothetical protein
VGDFDAPVSSIYTSSRQKNQQRILQLNDSIGLIDLTDIYSVFHPATAQYIFFSIAHGTFSKIYHTFHHKASLNKCKVEIIPCKLSEHNTIKLEFNSKRNSRKYSSNWRPNNALLHDQRVIEEIRVEIKKLLEFNENENTTHQNLWDRAKAVLRGKFITMSA